MQWKVACSMALLGFVANAAVASPVYMDSSGREWLDLNASRYHSWTDAAAVCDALTGACSGTLASQYQSSAGIDLSGYHWAARDEVRELFYEVAGLPSGALNGYAALFPYAAGYGGNAFDVLEPTIQIGGGSGLLNILNGITRDTYFDRNFNFWGAYNGMIGSSAAGADAFTLNGLLPTSIRDFSVGVYLYREVPVPEPGVLGLLGGGLIALVFSVGRRRRHGFENQGVTVKLPGALAS